jgi:hypothetical protein
MPHHARPRRRGPRGRTHRWAVRRSRRCPSRRRRISPSWAFADRRAASRRRMARRLRLGGGIGGARPHRGRTAAWSRERATESPRSRQARCARPARRATRGGTDSNPNVLTRLGFAVVVPRRRPRSTRKSRWQSQLQRLDSAGPARIAADRPVCARRSRWGWRLGKDRDPLRTPCCIRQAGRADLSLRCCVTRRSEASDAEQVITSSQARPGEPADREEGPAGHQAIHEHHGEGVVGPHPGVDQSDRH